MKNIYKYIAILLCCIGGIQQGNAQNTDVKDLFDKVTQSYNDKKQYQIDVTYNMHRGLTGNTVTESYEGKIVKNNDFSLIKIMDSEILQFTEGQLNINHAAKTAIYMNSKSSPSNQLLNINSFLEYYDKTIVTEKNGVLICEMVSTKPNIQNQYGKVILHINKENYWIEKQELFFSKLIPFVDNNTTRKMDYGRLVIYLKYRGLENSTAPVLKDYINVLSKQKITLAEQFHGYHLTHQAY
ncbi:hypothetical protein ATE84_4037 [Aquimarina sp. MAR_2010_214]|uniref:hypothetical protein n=1 Tax=Aquimarina sp. MAR_2010_214 TaxID=1250026 RepID=UPI000C70F08C|nr:hypothetical protein [Aquimarina sp. MAR_2010_214]PKV51937.1 hypothetical protein ATE84_4037 [Aquimarina sp. MAR_2010_214]